jgi:hypothetical protein
MQMAFVGALIANGLYSLKSRQSVPKNGQPVGL